MLGEVLVGLGFQLKITLQQGFFFPYYIFQDNNPCNNSSQNLIRENSQLPRTQVQIPKHTHWVKPTNPTLLQDVVLQTHGKHMWICTALQSLSVGIPLSIPAKHSRGTEASSMRSNSRQTNIRTMLTNFWSKCGKVNVGHIGFVWKVVLEYNKPLKCQTY